MGQVFVLAITGNTTILYILTQSLAFRQPEKDGNPIILESVLVACDCLANLD